MSGVSPVDGLAQTAAQVAQWIREADRVVIGAGSGLSAAAGLDFGDETDFAERFPWLVRRGLRAAYQMIGYSELSDAAFWAFWAVHVLQMRFADGRSTVYERLLRLVQEKDCFVLTTNVDAMFVRNGFDPERVWSIQGDYAFLQCLRPCTTEVWPSAPVLQRALAAIDPQTQEMADPARIPRCIRCGGRVFMNVRGGDWFLEEPYQHQMERWRSCGRGAFTAVVRGSSKERKGQAMNRRTAIGTTLKAAGAASVLRPQSAAAQGTGATAGTLAGRTLYLNPASGSDTHSGAQGSPLRTLAEAARRVNESSGSGPVTIVLSEGVYAVGETTLLKPERRSFSRKERLTIRAEVLPDDPEWDAGRMPTLIHTLPLSPTWNGRPDPLGGAANGMLIETSHVTVQGLKILGMPVVESPRPGLIRRLYAISRLRRDLEDLEVAQCLFAGEEVTNPNHVAIIANGSGVNVHHCVFRGLKISAVFWTPGSGGHAMTHCLSHELYGSAVWTAGIANDFEYRNNVVEGCNYVWTAQGGGSALADAAGRGARQAAAPSATPQEPVHYRVVDSYFARNRRLTGTGTGARLEYQDIDSSFLDLIRTKASDQPIVVERDQTKRNYLHPIASSEAATVGAGLFMKAPA